MSAGSELDVAYVARLARLRLSAEETELFQKQLGDILRYAQQVQQVDLSSVEEKVEAIEFAELREDKSATGLGAEAALANAPRQSRNLFIVPKVME